MKPRNNDVFSNVMAYIVILVGLKLLCTLLAIFVFARYSPLVDANLYLSGSFTSENILRTRMIQGITSELSRFGGEVFVHSSFGVFSLAGIIYYFLRERVRWQLCLPLLLPSTMIWTSVIGKEAIFYGAYTLSLVIWTRFILKRCDFHDYALLILACLLCFILRPHYTISLFWLFVSAIFVKNIKEHAWLLLLCLMGLFGLATIFIYTGLWEALIFHGFNAIDPDARASRFMYFGINKDNGAGFETYKSLIPLGAILGIIGPMPSELFSRPILTPFFLEGLLIIFFPVGIYFYASRQLIEKNEQFKAIFWLCLFPSILLLIAIHAPSGLLNPGSATRWRVNFEAIFHMAPLLLLYGFLSNNNHENSPFSS